MARLASPSPAAPAADPRSGRPAAAAGPPSEPTLGSVGIEEAARLVGVSPSAIRAWERQGLVTPARTPGRVRRYRPVDLERLRTIRSWRTIDGLNAAAIRRLLDARDGDADGRGGAYGESAGHGGPASAVAAARASDAPGRSSIAERLREVRLARGLTLRRAGERSGLSASFVSAVERGISGASVSSLRRLLLAYGTTLAEVLDGATDDPGRLVAASDRHAVEAGAGVRIENLARAPRLLEPQLFVLAAGASSHGPYSHPGEEFMYVLDGALGVWLEAADESYVLRPGDSLTFPSTLEHRFQALGNRETRVIWVNTPPTF
jgi:DNA-binding transcriptional MerR regulator/quercetin dioxygenase-like cupin family protein